jgi:U3 small nucleolar RNA-associated protein 14
MNTVIVNIKVIYGIMFNYIRIRMRIKKIKVKIRRKIRKRRKNQLDQI